MHFLACCVMSSLILARRPSALDQISTLGELSDECVGATHSGLGVEFE